MADLLTLSPDSDPEHLFSDDDDDDLSNNILSLDSSDTDFSPNFDIFNDSDSDSDDDDILDSELALGTPPRVTELFNLKKPSINFPTSSYTTQSVSPPVPRLNTSTITPPRLPPVPQLNTSSIAPPRLPPVPQLNTTAPIRLPQLNPSSTPLSIPQLNPSTVPLSIPQLNPSTVPPSIPQINPSQPLTIPQINTSILPPQAANILQVNTLPQAPQPNIPQLKPQISQISQISQIPVQKTRKQKGLNANEIEEIISKMPNITVSSITSPTFQISPDINDLLQKEQDEDDDDFETRKSLTLQLASIPDYKINNATAVTAAHMMMKKSKLGIGYDPDMENAIAVLVTLLQR